MAAQNPQKKCETLSSPKQSSEDHFWDYEQRLLGARNEKKRSVLLAHEHFLNEHNEADGSPKSPKKMRDLVEPQTIFRRPFLGL